MRRAAIGAPPQGQRDPTIQWLINAVQELSRASHEDTPELFQKLDATLTAIAALTGAADKGIYFTGTDVAALFDLTTAGRALLDDASAAAQCTTLGLGTGDSPTFTALTLSNGQIVFPATQNASANANTFDDYEEGTFTPVVSGTITAGAGTYSVQTGTYTKAGRVVFCITNNVWSAHTGTGNLTMSGNPFTAASGPEIPCAVWFQNLTYTTTFLARVNASATTISLNGNASGGAATAVAMDAAASLYLAFTYFV